MRALPLSFVPMLVAAGSVGALLAVPTTQPAAAAAVACSELGSAVLQRVKPSTGSSLLTVSKAEAAAADKDYGFMSDLGTAFRASSGARSGLVGVRRLYSPRTGDFLDTTDAAEAKKAVAGRGYRDQGVRYYVSTGSSSCLTPVRRFVKGGVHRMASSAKATADLTAGGWRNEGVKFYARAASGSSAGYVSSPIATTSGTTFSFAAVPDTQMEVLRSNDPRLGDRSRWVLQQPKMSFLLQTGDLVNWDTDDHAQWASAKRGLKPLEDARLPYTVAVGNHDTMATGVGGSARKPGNTKTLLRDTDTLNSYFDAADFRGVGGAFETGKVDNVFTLYAAGGLKWMVLTLEFCPRASAVEWARKAVASHPDYNVIISTHYYLNGNGSIGTTNSGYGDTSPTYLWQQVVSRYPNVKMVFSGHTGVAHKARVDTGAKGNKVYSFLTTMHDPKSNPTRLMTVDTAAGKITTRVYGPATKRSWTAYDQTLTGVTFVR